jgi:hypothetical protein
MAGRFDANRHQLSAHFPPGLPDGCFQLPKSLAINVDGERRAENLACSICEEYSVKELRRIYGRDQRLHCSQVLLPYNLGTPVDASTFACILNLSGGPGHTTYRDADIASFANPPTNLLIDLFERAQLHPTWSNLFALYNQGIRTRCSDAQNSLQRWYMMLEILSKELTNGRKFTCQSAAEVAFVDVVVLVVGRFKEAADFVAGGDGRQAAFAHFVALDFFTEFFEAFAVERAELVVLFAFDFLFGFGAAVALEVVAGLDDEAGQVVGEDGAACRVGLFFVVEVFEFQGDFF